MRTFALNGIIQFQHLLHVMRFYTCFTYVVVCCGIIYISVAAHGYSTSIYKKMSNVRLYSLRVSLAGILSAPDRRTYALCTVARICFSLSYSSFSLAQMERS
jgi:hypothetical protein